MRAPIAAAAALLSQGCVAKDRYAELEAMYDAAIEERDRSAAEREAAEDRLAELRRADRARLDGLAPVVRGLEGIQGEGLAALRVEDGRAALVIPAEGLFAPASAELAPEGAERIRRLAALLAASGVGRLQVEGHTDATAIDSKEFPTSWHLGADRAIAVTLALVAAGLPAERISAATFAEHGPEGGARIEIVAVPELDGVLPYRQVLERKD